MGTAGESEKVLEKDGSDGYTAMQMDLMPLNCVFKSGLSPARCSVVRASAYRPQGHGIDSWSGARAWTTGPQRCLGHVREAANQCVSHLCFSFSPLPPFHPL